MIKKTHVSIHLLYLLAAILPVTGIYAQKPPVLTLTTFLYDFGTIAEVKGPVVHDFPLTNTGGDTLVIHKVKTSAINVSGEMIPPSLAPGETGVIRVSLDPKDESGRIEKKISLRSNDPAHPVRQLSVFADVLPREKSLIDFYPIRVGNLMLRQRHLIFDQFKNTEVRSDTFRVFNAWYRDMHLAVKDPPAYTSWVVQPETLAPGAEGLVILTYDAGKSGKWGLDMDIFHLETNDSLDAVKPVTIGLNVVEDFSVNPFPGGKKPSIAFESLTHDFGTVRVGTTVDFTYVFTNKGKSDLLIRKVKASCGCTVSDLDKELLKPGESGHLKISFNSAGMSGKQSKSITVISNDPEKPVSNLSFSASVINE
ncbi:MAG TPA: DUF1573 domain-containing protein [Bacteroidales bacterium]|nr:DUF1573 domain-containing protein [Bacteroidales bacterium]HSA44050.1 DUF1573 domain-containing protein [Bacteroidales bacterium]